MTRAHPPVLGPESRRRCSCSNAVGACCELHRCDRVISESFLKCAHYWLAESGERRLWPRGCPNSIHNVLRPRVDEDLEELFAALGVVRQRSVCEAKPNDITRA